MKNFVTIFLLLFSALAMSQNPFISDLIPAASICNETNVSIKPGKGVLVSETLDGNITIHATHDTATIFPVVSTDDTERHQDKPAYQINQKVNGSVIIRLYDEESTIWKFTLKNKSFKFWQATEKPEHGFLSIDEKDFQVARYFDSNDMSIVQGINFLYLVSWTSGTVLNLNTGEIFE